MEDQRMEDSPSSTATAHGTPPPTVTLCHLCHPPLLAAAATAAAAVAQWPTSAAAGGGQSCGQSLKINNIEQSVSLDHTRHCIHTYNKNIQIYPRIHSTVNVIRTCLFILLSVLEVAQRVPPTCTRQTSRTADNTTFLRQHRLELSSTARCVQCVVFVYPRLLVCLLVGHFSGAGSGAQVVDVAPP